MELIAVAHEATPYGHVLVNGNAPELAALARMVGVSESEMQSLVDELDRNGVFSRTRAGVIYSRRMVKDAKKSAEGRKSVQKRWAQDTENIGENPPPNRPPTRDPNTKKPEARSQKDNYIDQFEDFWSFCPRKVGKGQARKAYTTALKKTSHDQLMAGMRQYAVSVKDRDPEFIAHPATWLNGERWSDEQAERAKPKW
jgi:DNA-binding Lrp family transcriptional regulator